MIQVDGSLERLPAQHPEGGSRVRAGEHGRMAAQEAASGREGRSSRREKGWTEAARPQKPLQEEESADTAPPAGPPSKRYAGEPGRGYYPQK